MFVIGLLLLDLLPLNRRAHAIRLGEALGSNLLVYRTISHAAGRQWLSGYLVEKALSADNEVIFLLVFTYFKVPAEYQHKLLF